tara:strand:- start:492 stop:803 length:312 start_codon:yes stop_codon:yes gene_type:complete
MRVFYSQKTESIIKKFELTDWRKKIQECLNETHQELSDNWLRCAIGERMKIEGRFLENVKDLTPEAIKLGYDFSVAMYERDNDEALRIIEKIEKLQTIWRDEV